MCRVRRNRGRRRAVNKVTASRAEELSHHACVQRDRWSRPSRLWVAARTGACGTHRLQLIEQRGRRRGRRWEQLGAAATCSAAGKATPGPVDDHCATAADDGGALGVNFKVTDPRLCGPHRRTPPSRPAPTGRRTTTARPTTTTASTTSSGPRRRSARSPGRRCSLSSSRTRTRARRSRARDRAPRRSRRARVTGTQRPTATPPRRTSARCKKMGLRVEGPPGHVLLRARAVRPARHLDRAVSLLREVHRLAHGAPRARGVPHHRTVEATHRTHSRGETGAARSAKRLVDDVAVPGRLGGRMFMRWCRRPTPRYRF